MEGARGKAGGGGGRLADLDDPAERFAFTLCRTLGNGRWKHPAQMMRELTAAEFSDWLALYNREPWGEERADMRSARECWAALQPHSRKALKESSYRLTFHRQRPPLTAEQYRAKAMRAYLGNGGRINGQADLRSERRADG